jgi:uncharacterized membrane protein YeaQ/YmgE (transglycosylase-associated protein family)
VELLFIVLIGVLAGLVARGVLPRHELTGVVLLPAVGGASAAIVWVALTWARMRWDGGWIWVATIAACLLTVVGAALLLARVRSRSDEALFEAIAKGAPAPAARSGSPTRAG